MNSYAQAADLIQRQQIDTVLAPEFVIELSALLEQALVESVNAAEENLDEDTFRAIVSKLQLTAWLAGYLTAAENEPSPEPVATVVLDHEEAAQLAYGLAKGQTVVRLVVWDE